MYIHYVYTNKSCTVYNRILFACLFFFFIKKYIRSLTVKYQCNDIMYSGAIVMSVVENEVLLMQ